MLGDEEIGEVDEIRHSRVDNNHEQDIDVPPSQRDCDSQHIRLQQQCGWQEDNNCYGSHVQKEVHGVELLPFRRQKDTLQHGLESTRCRGHDAHHEPIQVETWLASASNNHARNDGHEGRIHRPRLLPERHGVGEHGGEEGRGRSDGLVERHRQKPQRDVPADDGGAENDAERHNFEELRARSNGLHRHHLHPRDGDIAEERARGHVAHGEEDGEFEAIVAEQILVQQQHANVGEIPRAYQPQREHRGRHLEPCSHGSPKSPRTQEAARGAQRGKDRREGITPGAGRSATSTALRRSTATTRT